MTLNTNFAETFPKEITLEIFSHLDPKDVRTCNLVSNRWHKLADDNALWVRIIQKHFPQIQIPADCKNVKALVPTGYIASSQEEVLKALDSFLKKVQLNQTSTFSCVLNTAGIPVFSMSLAYKKNQSKSIMEKCTYLHKKEPEEKSKQELSASYQMKSDYLFAQSMQFSKDLKKMDFNDSFKNEIESTIEKRTLELDNQAKMESFKNSQKH